MRTRFLPLLFSGLLWCVGAVHALTPAQALSLSAGETDARIAALNQAVAEADPTLPAFLRALLDGEVKTPDGEEVVNNNRMRGALEAALGVLKLVSPDVQVRTEALDELRKQSLDEAQLPLIEKAYAAETDAALKARLGLMRATILITSTDPAKRLAAAQALAGSSEPAVKSLIQERLAPGAETDNAVRGALMTAQAAVEGKLAWGERLGVVFTGVSLGSILLLVALGLAITYGLMGVINMAHGELMMIGAYATYLVQNLFRQWLPPSLFDWYIVLAIPASFAVAALVGAVLERTVIRWLYGRPLETLLATWGISLVLMQGVRTLFGAQNVAVENPSWLSGGVQVMSNLILPYNRLAIIAFAFLVLAGVTLMINRTRLGLFVRGVTQNRRMAACVGINTARIDTYAFSLGAGIAGLAGCALSQIGNVGPDLGQSYIVDAFMVVVTGGVGQLAGTVYAALGLGVLNKFLEGFAGAVLAKIMVLVCIVVFIQKRPQGLFAMKGRSAEA
jgi:urea transport system permease protein